MANNREVKFNINMTGVPKVRADLKGMSADYARFTLSKEHEEQKHQLRMSVLKKKQMEIDSNAFLSSVKAHRSAVDAIEREQQRHQLRMTQMAERASLSEELESRSRGSRLLSSGGHLLQTAGFYRLGHLARAGASVSEGSGIGGALAMGAALGGAALAAKALEMGFDGLVSAVHSAISVLGEIGKARGVQEMFVEAADNERNMQLARMTVSASERATPAQLMRWASRMAGNPAFGGMKAEDWLKGAGVFGTETGLQKSLLNNQSLSNQLGMLAHMSGDTPSQIMSSYAAIYNQNRNLTQDQIMDIIRSGVGQGREGQFNVHEFSTAGGRLLSMPGTFFGGDYIDNVKSAIAYGALTKGKTPGHSLEEAGTEASAFFRELQAPAHRAAAKQLGVQFDKNGMILNPDEAIANVVANRQRALNLIPGLGGRESGPFIGHMATGLPGVTDKSTSDEIRKAVLDQIDHYKELSLSQDDLIRENNDAITVEDRMQAAFNRLADALEPGFLKVLEQIEPDVELFAKILGDNAGDIEVILKDIITAFEDMLPTLITVAKVLLYGFSSADDPNKIPMLKDLDTMSTNLQKSIKDKRALQAAGWTPEELKEGARRALESGKFPGFGPDFVGPLPEPTPDMEHQVLNWIQQNPKAAQEYINSYRSESHEESPKIQKRHDETIKVLKDIHKDLTVHRGRHGVSN